MERKNVPAVMSVIIGQRFVVTKMSQKDIFKKIKTPKNSLITPPLKNTICILLRNFCFFFIQVDTAVQR